LTIDFLKKCLDKDPAKRWSCEKLTKHSYFDDYIAKQREQEHVSSIEAANLRQQQLASQQFMLATAAQQLQTGPAQAAAIAAARDKSKVRNKTYMMYSKLLILNTSKPRILQTRRIT